MKNKLKEELKLAMKAREQIRVETIRSLISALQYEEIQKEVEELNPEQSLAVLKTELKKRKEECEFAEKAGRPEMLEKLKVEIAAIEHFLPTQLDAAALEKILTELKSDQSGLNMGAAMKILKERFAGQYDGKLASEVAKRVLG